MCVPSQSPPAPLAPREIVTLCTEQVLPVLSKVLSSSDVDAASQVTQLGLESVFEGGDLVSIC